MFWKGVVRSLLDNILSTAKCHQRLFQIFYDQCYQSTIYCSQINSKALQINNTFMSAQEEPANIKDNSQ